MNPARREHVRLSALRYVAASARYGLGTDVILQFIRSEGLREVAKEELEVELQYLAEKGLVTSERKLLSPEIPLWRITAAGRDHVAELKLDQE
jgi:hypothetical protein